VSKKNILKQILEAAEWSSEDRVWLKEYLDKNDTNELIQLLQEDFARNVDMGNPQQAEKSKHLLTLIHNRINSTSPRVIRYYRWRTAVAAAAVLIVIAVTYFIRYNTTDKHHLQAKAATMQVSDINPGGNKALLTLSDGSAVMLDSAKSGVVSTQGNATVMKLNDGELTYNTKGGTKEVLYNTVSTPKGGQYQLTLSDGSKVWMNAASSIRFPVVFSANERRVELTGEAYFEIAKDATRPFRINVAGKQEVEVLGTHFNVNAYYDESEIRTTLLEGKIKVSGLLKTVILAPGQQAKLESNGNPIVIANVDLEEVIAWKAGNFYFDRADLKTILRQFSRWYDVEVVYETEVINRYFFAIINRNSKLSEVLKALQANGVKFRIEGRKLIVQDN
jgi:ferric-dicitrate binding protein FerR (iron transport regulator)